MLEQIDVPRLQFLEVNIYSLNTKINSTTGPLKIGRDLVNGSTQKYVFNRSQVPHELRATGLGPGVLPPSGGASL
jgi:hypothetical protein